ncbi:Protein of unknown function [Propionibacterium freudenreichii]|nr:Protein of unknown function [Propionibacterium freudenreichii]
MTSTPIT